MLERMVYQNFFVEDFVESMKTIHKGKEFEINGSMKTYYVLCTVC